MRLAKYLTALALFVALATMPQTAFSYITLTTPYAVAINGSTVETDTIGACTGFAVDYEGSTMTYFFKIGTLGGSPSNLVPGVNAAALNQNISVTVNLLTGAYTTSQGGSGTVPGAILTNVNNGLISNRNTAESFMAVAGGLMPGATTAWTLIN